MARYNSSAMNLPAKTALAVQHDVSLKAMTTFGVASVATHYLQIKHLPLVDRLQQVLQHFQLHKSLATLIHITIHKVVVVVV